MTFIVKKFSELTNEQLYQIIKTRIDVFVVEQNCPYHELDNYDQQSYHMFDENGGGITAYLRILPAKTKYDECSIGRIIVNQEYRNKGVGSDLIKTAISFIEQNLEESKIRIQAQSKLEKFYQSFGFKPVSNIYLEDGIPHLDMIYMRKNE